MTRIKFLQKISDINVKSSCKNIQFGLTHKNIGRRFDSFPRLKNELPEKLLALVVG